jgi:hypothetical protein
MIRADAGLVVETQIGRNTIEDMTGIEIISMVSPDNPSKCGLLRKIGPDSYGATQRWAQFYNDDFWYNGTTGVQLPGTVTYPSCP